MFNIDDYLQLTIFIMLVPVGKVLTKISDILYIVRVPSKEKTIVLEVCNSVWVQFMTGYDVGLDQITAFMDIVLNGVRDKQMCLWMIQCRWIF